MDKLRFLVFSLGKEQYGVPLLQVKEVLAITEITPVPSMPVFFKGIMNLRGQVISILDLRIKFQIKTTPDKRSETAIVILDLVPWSIGMIVDSVDSVLSLTEEEIGPSPDFEGAGQPNCLQGVARKDKRLILLLDIEKALSMDVIRGPHLMNRNNKTA